MPTFFLISYHQFNALSSLFKLSYPNPNIQSSFILNVQLFDTPAPHALQALQVINNKTNAPAIIRDKSQTKGDRLQIALTHYHQMLQNHTQNPDYITKPAILQFERIYKVSKRTLGRPINKPSQKTCQLVNQEYLLLISDGKKVLVELLCFFDNLNISTSKSQLYDLAHILLHCHIPERIIVVNWIYRFWARHGQSKYMLVKAITTKCVNAVT